MTADNVQLSTLKRTLRRTFGFEALREGQEEVIRSILAGKDTLAIMPTGAGKSLCYQLPGIELPGTTVIVSPLISLMKDQVDKLQELGMDAAQVNSTLTPGEESDVLEEIRKEQQSFVFVTPERLAEPDFLATLASNRIALFVIDEAHCISQWGHDFRPAYLRVREAISALGDPTVLALTATATPEVIEDVRHQLGREEMEVIDVGVYRENLRLEVIPAAREEAKREALARLLGELAGAGIVYVSTVKDCEAVTEHLDSLGFQVVRYHGRLGARERKRNQERFMAGAVQVVVATNAFGMGIDKPDLRFVVHYNLPGSLEAYTQEAGRAGRDGEPARCILLYQQEDRNTQVFFLNGRYPQREHFLAVYKALERLGGERQDLAAGEVHERAGKIALAKVRVVLATLKDLGLVTEPEPGLFRLLRTLPPAQLEEMAARYERRSELDRDKLRRMVLYAQTALCRWKAVLDYFGEEPEWTRCGHCDNCAKPIRELAAPPPAELPLRPQTATEVLPLPPLVGDRRPEALQAGDSVTLSIFGAGQVRSVERGNMIITFGDGETREFRI
ncbi:MAG TPA: ATP-dependent DNA helicase RecQ [Thermoanaerobaculia bacterium]|nr:ATP-dependent DNA helicase RecQ [Thermoanaerobaculia bacterium]